MQQLADAVAGSRELLTRLLQFTRALFVRSRNPAYCLLRADVLLALRERVVMCFWNSCVHATVQTDATQLPAEVAADAATRFLFALDGAARELSTGASFGAVQQHVAAFAHSPTFDAAAFEV